MNTTILITPRAFGNIAAAAISHGCDITSYLIHAALDGSHKRSTSVPSMTRAEDAEPPVRIDSLSDRKGVGR